MVEDWPDLATASFELTVPDLPIMEGGDAILAGAHLICCGADNHVLTPYQVRTLRSILKIKERSP